MTIMMMMMMIMTDPFTTNLVVKGPVAKGSVVKGATSVDTIMIMILLAQGGDSSLCIRARLCPGSPDSLPHCGQVTILMMEMRLPGLEF